MPTPGVLVTLFPVRLLWKQFIVTEMPVWLFAVTEFPTIWVSFEEFVSIMPTLNVVIVKWFIVTLVLPSSVIPFPFSLPAPCIV